MLKLVLLSAWLFLTALCPPLLAAGNAMDLQLHNAAAADDAAAIATLLAKGAKIDARDESGATALLVAVHGNKVDAARALLEAGVDVADNDGVTPLQHARGRGYGEIVVLLEKARAK